MEMTLHIYSLAQRDPGAESIQQGLNDNKTVTDIHLMVYNFKKPVIKFQM